jgi:transposase InsO family protein
VPDILYTDNGADFTSKHLHQVAADLKIRLVFSIPGKPQGRGRIERFFRTVNEMFLSAISMAISVIRNVPRACPWTSLTNGSVTFSLRSTIGAHESTMAMLVEDCVGCNR